MGKDNIKVKHTEGLEKITEIKSRYVQNITSEVEKDATVIDAIIADLGLTESEFFSMLEGSTSENIATYDEALNVAREKVKSMGSQNFNR